MYADAIRIKRNPKGGTNFIESWFTNCNNTRVARAGAGPLHPGPDAPRRDPAKIIQEAIYNGK